MILLHPFTPRFEGLRQARQVRTLSPAEAQYFHGEEQKQLIDVLAESSIYVELNHSSLTGPWRDPVLRDALVAAIRPLAEAGLHFTVGSDNHNLAAVRGDYRPEVFCDACGIRTRQVNGIVRDLLAARALSGLTSNTPPAR